MPQPSDQVWQDVLTALRERLGEGRVNLWLTSVRPVAPDDGSSEDSCTLAVPSAFVRQWIQDRFLGEIEEALGRLEGRPRRVELRVDPTLIPVEEPQGTRSQGPCSQGPCTQGPSVSGPRGDRQAPRPPPEVEESSPLNGRFTMDRFVAGRSNLIAYRSALEVLSAPGRLYNPLYVYSETGLGKTHLLQAMAHSLRQAGRRVVHISCEQFVNKFVYAVSTRNSQSLRDFREHTRSADALLIDDVHLLRNKNATQVEFLHVYDALATLEKQIVLTADCQPTMIKRLKRELVTRFMSGMVARIDAPDEETRLAILRHRAPTLQTSVTEPVLRLLAHVPVSSVRELEGLLVRVVAHASLAGRDLDVALAREALADVAGSAPASVTLQGIEDVVSRYFEVSAEELRARTRRRSHTFPRQVGMYLARTLTACSLQEIGNFFGGKNHATVLYAERKITAARQQDPEVNEVCETLIGRFHRPQGRGTC